MERLDKLISNSTQITRKQSHRLIKGGHVKVNGIVTKDRGLLVNDDAQVSLDGREISLEKFVYIMLNKPKGVVSASKDDKLQTVIDLLPETFRRKNLFPAGRLDRDTTGFVLITDNGDFAHRILSSKNHVPKTYEAALAAPLSPEDAERLRSGIILGDGTHCLPAEVEIIKDGENPSVRVVLIEGKYHQIKRMFAAVGNRVTELMRIKIGSLELDSGLSQGECRLLAPKEVLLIEN